MGNNTELICIAVFDFRRNQYHLEKLLPVWLPEYESYIALCFEFSHKYGSRISGIGLDLVDMMNKASLIKPVSVESWLNPCNSRTIINNLDLYSGPAPRSDKKNQQAQPQSQQQQPVQHQEQQQWNLNDSAVPDPYGQLIYSNEVADNQWMTSNLQQEQQQQMPSYPPSMPTLPPTPSITPEQTPAPSTPCVSMVIQNIDHVLSYHQAQAQYLAQYLMVPIHPSSIPQIPLNLPIVSTPMLDPNQIQVPYY